MTLLQNSNHYDIEILILNDQCIISATSITEMAISKCDKKSYFPDRRLLGDFP